MTLDMDTVRTIREVCLALLIPVVAAMTWLKASGRVR